MKLRLGTFRQRENIRQFRPFKRANMVNTQASGSQTQLLTHHLVQKSPHIEKFAGRVNGYVQMSNFLSIA